MKKSKLTVVAITVIACAILFIFPYFYFRSQYEKKLMARGRVVVTQVENFRKEKGRLPDSLTELGLAETEAGPLFYQKRGELNYAVFFSLGVDDIKAYYSDSQKWEDSYRK